MLTISFTPKSKRKWDASLPVLDDLSDLQRLSLAVAVDSLKIEILRLVDPEKASIEISADVGRMMRGANSALLASGKQTEFWSHQNELYQPHHELLKLIRGWA